MARLRCGWWSGGCVGEDDFLAGVEALDLADLVPGLAGGAAGAVVVRSQFLVPGGGVADEDPGDLADDAGDRDDGFLLAALAGDAAVQRAQPGIGPGGGHRGLAERAAQVPVALAGAAGLRGLAGLPGARGQAGPSGGGPGGGGYRRVGAELGDDDPGVALADAGDLIQPPGQAQQGGPLAGAAGGVPAAGQPAGGAARRGAGDLRQLLPDRLIQAGDLGVDRVDEPQVRADLQRVDVAEPAGQRVLQLPAGGPQPPVPPRRQRPWASLPATKASKD